MRSSAVDQLQDILAELSGDTKEGVLRFYSLLVEENERQNLTRLISPPDFKNGHVLDVLELHKTGWLTESVVDLGSGCGVPGLLAGLIEPREWTLVESEKRKAEFLERVVQELRLGARVKVRAERIEHYLKTSRADVIVARAVGSVERIYSWISKCSTWNTLLLLKGPGWEDEWARFQETRFKGELVVTGVYSYRILAEGPMRKIVKIERKRPQSTRPE